jgi:Zn-dependent M28 family amino/carboxypeptidase
MSSRKPACLALVLLAASSSSSSSREPAAPGLSRASSIVAETLRFASAYERLRVLTDTIGARLAGSAAELKAIAWAKSEFEKDGLAVRLEPVMVPVWVRGEERADIVAPMTQPLVILGLGGSVGTPAGGITAPVVVVGSSEELNALGADKVRGRIVLYDNPFVRTAEEFSDYGRAVKYRGSGASDAARLGAVAALVRSVATATLRTPHTGALRYADDAPKIPAAAVTIEDAMLIHRLADSGQEIRVRLVLDDRAEPDRQGANVVAEIPGREKPEEIVLIGAHLDSWDVGTGAIDDGAGCAMVLEAMRVIAAGPAPRRTVRAVLFANEENGLRGGRAYRDAHQAELDRHVAAIEADSGAARALGLSVQAGDGGVQMVGDLLTSLLAPIGAARFREGHGGSDISPLESGGVPMLGLSLESTRYFDWHHTAADTLDKVDPAELQQATATMAAAAWALADAAGTLPRVPPRPAAPPSPGEPGVRPRGGR